jgi:beta-N-acetylhexosaminidase
VSLDSLREAVASPSSWATANSIATRAITLLRDSASLVPADRNGSVALFVYAPDAEIAAGTFFTAEARALARNVRPVRLSPRSSAAELDSLARDAGRADRIVVYTYTRTLEAKGASRSRHGGLVRQQPGRTGKLVVVAGGNPYQIRQMAAVPTYLVTYGRGEALERAAARAVFGAAPISGRTPVSLPGYFARGDGLSRGQGHAAGVATPPALPCVRPASPAVFPAPAPRVDAAARRALADTLRAVLERGWRTGPSPAPTRPSGPPTA